MRKLSNRSRKIIAIWVGLTGYFLLAIILKLCGVDLFTITGSSEALQNASNVIMSNVYLYGLVASTLLDINFIFTIGFANREFSAKKLLIYFACLLPCLYGINLGIFFLGITELIITTVIPILLVLAISLIKPKRGMFNKMNIRLDSFLTTLILCLAFFGLSMIIQQGLMYVKINLICFNYIPNNMFNEILLNLDFIVFLLAIYESIKIYIKGDKENGI